MTHVQMSQLVEGSEINSRQGADRKEGIVELAASIKAHGLILPLAVRALGVADDKTLDPIFEIVDGHRRFAALKKLKWSEPVPVNVIMGDGRAQSLAANIERLPLHPVDQYDALARLSDEGWSSDKIMKAFNLSSLQVRRVLALAKMSAKVRTAWKKGEIKQEIAQVFTLTQDLKLQDAVLKKVIEHKGYGGMQAYEVRQLLTSGQRPVGLAIDFIGVERITAAGVQITEDLFAEREDSRFMCDRPEILQQLVDAKVLEVAADLGARGFNIITDYDESMDYEDLDDPKPWDGTQDIAQYLDAIPADKRDLTWLLDFGHKGLRLDGPLLVTELNGEDEDGDYAADEDDATDPAATPEQLAERAERQEKLRAANEKAAAEAAEKREALGLETITAALAQDVRQWRATAFRAAYEGQGKAFLKVMLHNAHARYFGGLHLGQIHGDGVEMKEYASVTVMADQIASAYHMTIDASTEDAAAVLAELLNDSRRLRPLLWTAFEANIESYFKRSKIATINEALEEMGATAMGSVGKEQLVAYAVKKATEVEWLPKLMRIGLNATQAGVAKPTAKKAEPSNADLEARDAAIAEAAYDHADVA